MNTQIPLNHNQKEAVEYIKGPLLILAGAGAGKTKTITERILNLIHHGVDPLNILAVTFTNKASEEMRNRIRTRLAEANRFNDFESLPTIKTFHGLGLLIIKENRALLGLPMFPTIIDAGDQLSIIKRILNELSIDPKIYEPSMIRGAISKNKNESISQSEYQESVSNSKMDVIATVWRRYNETLASEKLLDFDDLLIRSVNLLKSNDKARKYYQNRFKYIHIDEYQDTNDVQYEFIKLLVSEEENICVVGDIDQNIYSWRGAKIKNIMNFERDYKGAKTILLEENYRSTARILRLANNTISKNTVRVEKNLFTRGGDGHKITVLPSYNEWAEARNIAMHAKSLIEEGVSPDNIAVLVRANYQSRVLEEAFLKEGVQYLLLGTKFFERKEIKDVLAYLRASFNRDSLPDMIRVFETPKKGLGKATIAKYASKEALPAKSAQKIKEINNLLDKVLKDLETSPLSHVLKELVITSGIEKELKGGTAEDEERLLNIYELVTLSIKYDHLDGTEGAITFLEEASLQSDQDEDKKEHSGVRIMTIHASKGLEFDAVFISGLEEGLFPHERLGKTKRPKEEEEEEERRLFYVAVTRARKKLFLSYAEIRTIFGQKQINFPSVFLDDLIDEDTNVESIYYDNREKSDLFGEDIFI